MLVRPRLWVLKFRCIAMITDILRFFPPPVLLPIAQHPSRLQTLSANNIGITDEGFCNIVGAVARAGVALKSVDLRHNALVEMDGRSRAIAIGGMRSFNKTCVVLHE